MNEKGQQLIDEAREEHRRNVSGENQPSTIKASLALDTYVSELLSRVRYEGDDVYHKGWINLTREELEDLRIVVSHIVMIDSIDSNDRGSHVRISDRMLRKVRATHPNVECKLELEEEKKE